MRTFSLFVLTLIGLALLVTGVIVPTDPFFGLGLSSDQRAILGIAGTVLAAVSIHGMTKWPTSSHAMPPIGKMLTIMFVGGIFLTCFALSCMALRSGIPIKPAESVMTVGFVLMAGTFVLTFLAWVCESFKV